MLSKRLMGAAVAVLAVTTAAACGSPTTAGSDTSPAAAATSAASTAPVVNGVSQVKIDLTGDAGGQCALSHPSAAAGPVTFTVSNSSAASLTEIELQSGLRIIGERENLAPGLPASSFTLTLDGGSYTLYCPGASPETQTFTVTGKAPATSSGDAAQLLQQGTKGYATYANDQAAAMVTAVKALDAAVDSGDLTKAQQAYVKARPFYERIESDVEGFVLPGSKVNDNSGFLDYLIDMRASNLDPAVGWSGLHAVERDLYGRKKITAQTKTYTADLVTHTEELNKLIRTLSYKPEDLANGAAGLLEEVQRNKITGEEEAYSHIDLATFASNIEGAQQAFAYLEPGLTTIDPTLTSQVATQFASVTKALDALQDKDAPGGYLAWTPANRAKYGKSLSQKVLALQQPFQRVAEKVATAQ